MPVFSYFTASRQKIVLEILVCIQVLVFVYTGSSKLPDHHNFSTQLGLLIPWPAVAVFTSYAIPLAEILIALGLCLQHSRLPALYAYSFLMIVFTIYIGVLLLGSRALPCSCGGVISSITWKQHLVFNLALLLLSVSAIGLHQKLHSK